MAKILVVDDSEHILSLVTQILGDKHEVFTASCWSEANQYLFREKLQLVLLDVNLPGVTGEKICGTIKDSMLNKSCEFQIILFSAMDEGKLRRLAREHQADGYLQKDLNPTTLSEKINAIIDSNKLTN